MTAHVFTQGKWIIAFFDNRDPGDKNWWHWFTKPGFRHCFALRYLGPMDAWALVDWSNVGLNVDFMPKQIVDAVILGVNDNGGAFIEVDVKPQPRRIIPPLPLYCVTAIKELVGLRAWWVITPWQLYCALMKRGATQTFNLSHLKENADGQRTQTKSRSA